MNTQSDIVFAFYDKELMPTFLSNEELSDSILKETLITIS